MKIFAAVPTYNRPDCLLKNINCLIKQDHVIEKIIIVDNASDSETRKVLQKFGHLSNPRIHYVRLDKNIGSSGGFRVAMEVAVNQGAEWIWGMDDDAFPREDALSKLIDIHVSEGYHCLWSNPDEDTDFEGPVKYVKHLMFVGYLVSREIVDKIGFPDQNFYMYHDDTEYSQRIINHGFAIVKVRDSVIDHKGYDKRGVPLTTYNLLICRFTVLNSEPYRIYYIFRNTFFIKRKGIERSAYLIRTIFLSFPKYLISRPKSGVAIFIAVYHYFINKRGYTKFPASFYRKYS